MYCFIALFVYFIYFIFGRKWGLPNFKVTMVSYKENKNFNYMKNKPSENEKD